MLICNDLLVSHRHSYGQKPVFAEVLSVEPRTDQPQPLHLCTSPQLCLWWSVGCSASLQELVKDCI